MHRTSHLRCAAQRHAAWAACLLLVGLATGCPVGQLEKFENKAIHGWAYDTDVPGQPVTVKIHLIAPGQTEPFFIGSTLANLPGGPGGNHGFVFSLASIADTVFIKHNKFKVYAEAVSLVDGLSYGIGSYPFEFAVGDGAEIGGVETVVIDYQKHHCAQDDIPDAPAKAFRDSAGNVQLLASNSVGRRSIGASLATVKHRCEVTMPSGIDPNPSHFDHYTWIASPYTLDGTTIYAINHHEYHGHEVPGMCPSGGFNNECWWNVLTFARSTDGGSTYTRDLVNQNHLVAALPYPYLPDKGPYGVFMPSNVVFNPADGYYYFLTHAIGPSLTGMPPGDVQTRGTCVLRTQTLGDPQSWRAWGGPERGFTVTMPNPYPSPPQPIADHLCTTVSPNELGIMESSSLTFNTHFNQFLLVGFGASVFGATTKWGIHYSTSPDLITWTPRKLIFQADFPFSVPVAPGDFHQYPSVLDPNSTTVNFETSGQTAWLYFLRWRRGAENFWRRDLKRIPIRFY